MEVFLVAVVAAGAAVLTFFSGFGLGTILTPFFALFFPVETAIAATAVVHFSNNIFKTGIIGKHINYSVLLKFGAAALPAAAFGAVVLSLLSNAPALTSWQLNGKIYAVLPVKLISGLLMILFSAAELTGKFDKAEVTGKHLFAGGLLSGFFGGISGNQGAFRSMFLLHSGLSKEAYIATGTGIALLVDIGRLFIYGKNNSFASLNNDAATMIYVAIIAAFAGSLTGKKVLKKVTVRAVQVMVAVFITAVGALLCAGIL